MAKSSGGGGRSGRGGGRRTTPARVALGGRANLQGRINSLINQRDAIRVDSGIQSRFRRANQVRVNRLNTRIGRLQRLRDETR